MRRTRTLVAVRAMVPVTQMPPNRTDADIGDALRAELAVRAMSAAAHAVGDDGGEQRLDRAEQRDATASGSTACSLARLKVGSAAPAASVGTAAECDVDGRDVEMQRASIASEATTTAIRKAGQVGRSLPHQRR